jgi:hypothetical protein
VVKGSLNIALTVFVVVSVSMVVLMAVARWVTVWRTHPTTTTERGA